MSFSPFSLSNSSLRHGSNTVPVTFPITFWNLISDTVQAHIQSHLVLSFLYSKGLSLFMLLSSNATFLSYLLCYNFLRHTSITLLTAFTFTFHFLILVTLQSQFQLQFLLSYCFSEKPILWPSSIGISFLPFFFTIFTWS